MSGFNEMNEEYRLKILVQLAYLMGLSLDELEVASRSDDAKSFNISCDKSSLLPKNRKSSVVP
jgi:hypothetical protein